MLTLHSPATGNHLTRPKTRRRPLQSITNTYQKPHQKHVSIDTSHASNKENPTPNRNEKTDPDQNRSSIAAANVQIEQFEVSLADELTAIRLKMERLKADKEKTEKMLRDREMMMEMKMKELDQRGEVQKVLEIEVDRLFRLNELKSLCNRILPIRSLREKEQEKIKPDRSQGGKVEELEEKKGLDSL